MVVSSVSWGFLLCIYKGLWIACKEIKRRVLDKYFLSAILYYCSTFVKNVFKKSRLIHLTKEHHHDTRTSQEWYTRPERLYCENDNILDHRRRRHEISPGPGQYLSPYHLTARPPARHPLVFTTKDSEPASRATNRGGFLCVTPPELYVRGFFFRYFH